MKFKEVLNESDDDLYWDWNEYHNLNEEPGNMSNEELVDRLAVMFKVPKTLFVGYSHGFNSSLFKIKFNHNEVSLADAIEQTHMLNLG